jgi:hypothetical protein
MTSFPIHPSNSSSLIPHFLSLISNLSCSQSVSKFYCNVYTHSCARLSLSAHTYFLSYLYKNKNNLIRMQRDRNRLATTSHREIMRHRGRGRCRFRDGEAQAYVSGTRREARCRRRVRLAVVRRIARKRTAYFFRTGPYGSSIYRVELKPRLVDAP